MSPYYPPHNCSSGAALSRFSHLRSEGHIPASADALSMQLEARQVDWDNLPPAFLYISPPPLFFSSFFSTLELQATTEAAGGYALRLPRVLFLLVACPFCYCCCFRCQRVESSRPLPFEERCRGRVFGRWRFTANTIESYMARRGEEGYGQEGPPVAEDSELSCSRLTRELVRIAVLECKRQQAGEHGKSVFDQHRGTDNPAGFSPKRPQEQEARHRPLA